MLVVLSITGSRAATRCAGAGHDLRRRTSARVLQALAFEHLWAAAVKFPHTALQNT